MSDSKNTPTTTTEDEIVDISVIQQQVRYMRKRKSVDSTVTSMWDTTHEDPELSSESDYQLSETGIHSSDSEWSSGDDDVLQIRKERRHSSDYDLPLINLSSKTNETEQQCSSQQQPFVQHHTEMDNTEREDDREEVIQDEGVPPAEALSGRGRGKKRISGRNRAEQKRRRDHGLSFLTRSGSEREAKIMRLGCGKNCTKKCHGAFNEGDREAIFNSFWKLGDNTAQRLFVVTCAERKSRGRTYVKHTSRRQSTILYSFTKNGTKISVCKKFFLDTLAIKEDFVYTALKCHSGDSIDDTIVDKRGRHGNHVKLSERIKSFVRNHIASFQPVESHYCRQGTTKRYLPETLSIQEMYRLYCQEYDKNGEQKASNSVYRSVFKSEFNLGFHKPKKDQCDLCLAFKACPSSVDEETMREHLAQKELAREAKERYKRLSSQDETHSSACFDLQKVLECPHGEASSFYYSRKLAVYNLTIYELDTAEGHCYMWPEHLAKRGANEVSSCLFNFFNEKAKEGKKTVYTFSDNCTGQNRNRGIATMMWYTIKCTPLQEIIHTYLKKGHTQNENDSMHSVIERSARHATVFTPDQWYALVRNARKNKHRYAVKEMSLNDFSDFMGMASQIKKL